jgi:hypothetical protein
METLFFWVGGAVVVGVVTLAASVLVQWRTAMMLRPYQDLVTSIRELDHQVSDLADHFERKETRERVRRLRDSHAKPENTAAAPSPGTPEFKAHLRRLALAKSGA